MRLWSKNQIPVVGFLLSLLLAVTSSLCCVGLLTPASKVKHKCWDTTQGKLCHVANNQFLRVRFIVDLFIIVLNSWSLPEAFSLLLRYLVTTLGPREYWILTWLVKILCIHSLKFSSLIYSIKLSEDILIHKGSSTHNHREICRLTSAGGKAVSFMPDSQIWWDFTWANFP